MSHKYRYVATAALAVVLAAGAAACGTDSEPQLRSEGASVQQNAEYLEQAGGAPLGLPDRAPRHPAAVEAAARAARVAQVAGSDRHLDMAAEAEAARTLASPRLPVPTVTSTASPPRPRRSRHGWHTPPAPTSTSRTSPTSSRVGLPWPACRSIASNWASILPTAVLGGFSDRGCQRTRPVARPGSDRR